MKKLLLMFAATAAFAAFATPAQAQFDYVFPAYYSYPVPPPASVSIGETFTRAFTTGVNLNDEAFGDWGRTAKDMLSAAVNYLENHCGIGVDASIDDIVRSGDTIHGTLTVTFTSKPSPDAFLIRWASNSGQNYTTQIKADNVW